MAANERPPSHDVEVTVDMGSPNYQAIASTIHGPENVGWWTAIGDLLGGRPGWRCELTEHGLTWLFGPMGSGLFTITAPDADAEDEADADVAADHYATGRYEVFDYEADGPHSFNGTTELREWLDSNEHRHSDHLEKIHELVSAMDWDVLKGMGLEALVTHDGQTWIATIPKLVLESTFADDFPTLLVRVRELIAHATGAPADIAQDISITARLDVAATAALA